MLNLDNLNNTLDASEFVTNLPTGDTPDTTAFDISLIKPNPHQPRFDEDVEELKAAILGAYNDLIKSNIGVDVIILPEDGLLQPILITPNDDGTFTCVGGHRRLKACTQLNHGTIKANLIVLDETQLITFSIMENLQRVDLTPFETALAVDKAITSRSFESEGQLAAALGKSSSWISKCKSVLKLSTVILDDLHQTKTKIGLEILNDLQRLQSTSTAEDLYFKYQANEIKGSDIRDAIKLEKNQNNVKSPMFSRRGSNINITLDCSTYYESDIDDIQDKFLDFLENLKTIYGTLPQEVEQPNIKLMEVLAGGVYIEYENGNSHNVTFSVAKGIIKKSSQIQLKYTDCSGCEAGSDFLNTIPNMKQQYIDNENYLKWNYQG